MSDKLWLWVLSIVGTLEWRLHGLSLWVEERQFQAMRRREREEVTDE